MTLNHVLCRSHDDLRLSNIEKVLSVMNQMRSIYGADKIGQSVNIKYRVGFGHLNGFTVTTGLSQGDAMSSALFIIALENCSTKF